MKFSWTFLAILFFACLNFGVQIGCQSTQSKQLVNPFETARQTVPPPCTLTSSPQTVILGQQFSTSTNLPVGMSVPGVAPAPSLASPIGAPMPSASGNATPLASPPVSVPHISTVPPPISANPLPTTASNADIVDARNRGYDLFVGSSAYTGETAFQNIETRANSIKTATTPGSVQMTAIDKQGLVISSAPFTTQVGE
ncbi:MAG: hypothetical protein ACRCUY_07055 [Thermoguttaceae bacterium]